MNKVCVVNERADAKDLGFQPQTQVTVARGLITKPWGGGEQRIIVVPPSSLPESQPMFDIM